jgi:hypothetical protein
MSLRIPRFSENATEDPVGRVPDEHVVRIEPIVVTAPLVAAPATARSAPKPTEPESDAVFDYAAAMRALQQAPSVSSICGADATGPARVSATFAPSGRPTRVLVLSEPLKGTEVGGCVARMLRRVTVPPFASGFVTVTEMIALR